MVQVRRHQVRREGEGWLLELGGASRSDAGQVWKENGRPGDTGGK